MAYGSIICIGLVAAYFCFFGPRVPVAGGLGWDGQDYAVMTQNLLGAIKSGQFSTYRLLRFFPSLVLNLFDLAIGRKAPTTAQIIDTYAVANLIAILGTAALWARISMKMRMRPLVTWLGSILLLTNFCSLRVPFFAPVSTDCFALFLSMLSLMFYLERRAFLLWLVTLAVVFTWPIAIIPNGLMLATQQKAKLPLKEIDSRLFLLLRAGVVALILVLAIYFVYVAPTVLPYGSAQVFLPLAPVSILILAAYSAWVAFSVSPLRLLRNLRPTLRGTASLIAVIAIYLLVRHALAMTTTQPDPISASSLLRGIIVSSVVRPAQFIVSHVSYFNVWPVLFVALLRPEFEEMSEFPALYLILALAAAFFPLSESRMSIYFLPTVLFAVSRVLSKRDIKASRLTCCVLFAVGIVGARCWLQMASGPYGTLLDFPAQLLFMQIGPWMSDVGYKIAVVQTVGISAVLAWVAQRSRRAARFPVTS